MGKETESQKINTLVRYIRQAKKYGLTNIAIEMNLRKAGWDEKIVTRAWLKASPKPKRAPIVKTVQRRPRKKTKLLRRIQYVSLALLLLFVAFGAAVYRIVTSNASVLGFSYASLAANSIQENFTNLPLTIHITYADPGNVSIAQGTKQAAYTKPKVELEMQFTGIRNTGQYGQAHFKFTNGTETKYVSANVTKKNKALHILPLTTDLEGPMLGKVNAFKNTWLEAQLPDTLKVTEPLLIAGTNLGIENHGGKKMAHLKYKLNIEFLKNIIANLPTGDSTLDINETQVNFEELKKAYAQGLNSSEVDVLVNVYPIKLNHLEFSLNAPSVTKAIIGNAGKDENLVSAQILANMYKVQASLEEFNKTHKGYPQESGNIAQGINIPWPKFEATSACPARYQQPAYTPEGEPDKKTKLFASYNVTFCLPETIGSTEGGIGILTPTELYTQTGCPGTTNTCFKPQIKIIPQDGTDALPLLAGKMNIRISPFSGNISAVDEPANTKNLGDALKELLTPTPSPR